MTQAILFSRRGFLRPSFAARHESFASRTKKGGGAPNGAPLVSAPHCRRCRPFCGVAARALIGRARLPALHRGSCQKPRGPWLSPVPRFMVADNRSAPRAASSWQTGDVAGRASFRTARAWSAKPRTGTALAPLSRSHPESALRRASGAASIRCARPVKQHLHVAANRLILRRFLLGAVARRAARERAFDAISKNHRSGHVMMREGSRYLECSCDARSISTGASVRRCRSGSPNNRAVHRGWHQ